MHQQNASLLMAPKQLKPWKTKLTFLLKFWFNVLWAIKAMKNRKLFFWNFIMSKKKKTIKKYWRICKTRNKVCLKSLLIFKWIIDWFVFHYLHPQLNPITTLFLSIFIWVVSQLFLTFNWVFLMNLSTKKSKGFCCLIFSQVMLWLLILFLNEKYI